MAQICVVLSLGTSLTIVVFTLIAAVLSIIQYGTQYFKNFLHSFHEKGTALYFFLKFTMVTAWLTLLLIGIAVYI